MSASPEQKTDEPVKSQAVRWLLGQEANTVALFLIGAALFYGGWHAMTIGIPAHLKTIQDGYERLDDRHEKSRAVDRETYKDAVDRIERRSVMRAAATSPRPSFAHTDTRPDPEAQQ